MRNLIFGFDYFDRDKLIIKLSTMKKRKVTMADCKASFRGISSLPIWIRIMLLLPCKSPICS